MATRVRVRSVSSAQPLNLLVSYTPSMPIPFQSNPIHHPPFMSKSITSTPQAYIHVIHACSYHNLYTHKPTIQFNSCAPSPFSLRSGPTPSSGLISLLFLSILIPRPQSFPLTNTPSPRNISLVSAIHFRIHLLASKIKGK